MAKTVKKATAKKTSAKKAAPAKQAKAQLKKAAKKNVVKRSFSPKPDMPKLLDVFARIRKLMKKYEPPMNARVDIEGRYDLWSEKSITAFNRQYDAMSYACIIIQSGYVGFYYMPIYGEPERIGKRLKPEFMKLLKGKACFHIKEWTPVIEEQIRLALEIGYKGYKEKGWV